MHHCSFKQNLLCWVIPYISTSSTYFYRSPIWSWVWGLEIWVLKSVYSLGNWIWSQFFLCMIKLHLLCYVSAGFPITLGTVIAHGWASVWFFCSSSCCLFYFCHISILPVTKSWKGIFSHLFFLFFKDKEL